MELSQKHLDLLLEALEIYERYKMYIESNVLKELPLEFCSDFIDRHRAIMQDIEFLQEQFEILKLKQ